MFKWATGSIAKRKEMRKITDKIKETLWNTWDYCLFPFELLGTYFFEDIFDSQSTYQ